MEQTYEEAITKTVAWWVKVMQQPMNQDNGADNAMMEMLMNTVSMNAQKDLTKENLEVFSQALIDLLSAQDKKKYNRGSLSVDYAPCDVLSTALIEAGIDAHVLPCKSNSYIDQETNEVKAVKGYGKPYNVV